MRKLSNALSKAVIVGRMFAWILRRRRVLEEELARPKYLSDAGGLRSRSSLKVLFVFVST